MKGSSPLDQVGGSFVFGREYVAASGVKSAREAGVKGSMGKVACASSNALMESFWGSTQIELLDRRYWSTRAELASAMFEWIEAFYNPVRRHYLQRTLSQRGESLHFFSLDRRAVRLP